MELATFERQPEIFFWMELALFERQTEIFERLFSLLKMFEWHGLVFEKFEGGFKEILNDGWQK